MKARTTRPLPTKKSPPVAGSTPPRVIDLKPTTSTELVYPRANDFTGVDWMSPRTDTNIPRETPSIPNQPPIPTVPVNPGPVIPTTQPIETNPNVPIPQQPQPPQRTVQPAQPNYHNEEAAQWTPTEPITTEQPTSPAPVLRCPEGTHWDSVVHACVPDVPPASTTKTSTRGGDGSSDGGDDSGDDGGTEGKRGSTRRRSDRQRCYDDEDDCGCMDGLASGPPRSEYY